jgi:hypothetical protein
LRWATITCSTGILEPVALAHRDLAAPGAVADRRLHHLAQHAPHLARRVVARDVLGERLVVRQPQHPAPRPVQVERPPRDVAGADEVGRRLDDRDEPRRGLLGVGALADVAEAPDAADHLARQPLRLRVALEHPAVAEVQRVQALGLGLRVERPHPVDERLRVLQLLDHVRERPLLARGQQLARHAPHRAELLVEAHHAAGEVGHHDAVGGRLEGRLDQRQRVLALGLRAAPLRDVPEVRHQAADGRAPPGGSRARPRGRESCRP